LTPDKELLDSKRPRLSLSELLEGKEVMVEFAKTEESKRWEVALPVGKEIPSSENSSG
jgi:hypothetical protein